MVETNPERILAIDVGTGTQDILVYDPERSVENSVQLVLPSPVAMAAQRARMATREGRAIFLTGDIMGGWPLNTALKEHLKQGYSVFATERAARTIHDDLAMVEEMGVFLSDSAPPGAEAIECGDVDLTRLGQALGPYGVSLPERVAVAVQDHGESIGVSNRDTRSHYWQSFIEGGGRLSDLAFTEAVPPQFTRMAAVRRTVAGALLMDTGPAAMLGALLDDRVAERAGEGILVVNVGNGHTFGALVQGDRVWGLFEEHTFTLTPERLHGYVEAFRGGRLSHEEVYAGGGHGCYYHPGYRNLKPFAFTTVTGPNRRIAAGLGYHPAVPFGDMMLGGCFGLLRAAGALA